MAGQLTKVTIGKEDLELQEDTGAATTFERISSVGASVNITKIPDFFAYGGALRSGDIITKGPWIDVRAHLAVGDKTADDTIALRNAFDSASAGDVVYFPPGYSFKITGGITIPIGITVWGYGSTIYADGALNRTVDVTGLSSDADSYFLFWNGASRNITGGVPAQSASGIIENVFIYGLTFENTESLGGTYRAKSQPIALYGVSGGAIKDCKFINGASEQILSDAILENFEISNNYFYNCVQDGIAPVVTKDVHIHDNIFIDVAQPMEMSGYKVKINDNKINTTSANGNNGIWISNTSLDIDLYVEIENNTVDGYFGHHILVSDVGSQVSNFKEVNVIGNTIRGKVSASTNHYLRVDTGQGVYNISNNNFDDYLADANSGYFIDINGSDTTGKYFVGGNRAIVRTAYVDEFIAIPSNLCISTKNNEYLFKGGSFRSEGGLKAYHGITLDNSGVSTSGTGEDDLKSVVIPANYLNVKGGITVFAAGTFTGANDTKVIKLHFGATSWTVISAAAADEYSWSVKATIFNTATNSQRVSWEGMEADGTALRNPYTTAAIDTTANVTLKLTGQCTNAGDTINQYMWIVKDGNQ